MNDVQYWFPKFEHGSVSFVNVPDSANPWPELSEHFATYKTKTPLFLAEPLLQLDLLFYLTTRIHGLPALVAPPTNLPLILKIIDATSPDTFVGQIDLIEIVLKGHGKDHTTIPFTNCFTFLNEAPEKARKLEDTYGLPVVTGTVPIYE